MSSTTTTIAPPKPLSYATINGHRTAVFGPELRDFIRATKDKSFPIVDENSTTLHTFQITDDLRAKMA